MEEPKLREAVLASLHAVAPESVDVEFDPARPLRDQVDLDSMDALRFWVGIHERLGVEVPAADMERLRSLDEILGYLAARGLPPG
jgi:acyl carrier protein